MKYLIGAIIMILLGIVSCWYSHKLGKEGNDSWRGHTVGAILYFIFGLGFLINGIIVLLQQILGG
ncbi:MAG: hypothetical protein DRO67_10365 [Candidatus Asgardarchaeum californiense]|nr:MAG: hypothetical protein DRO67_10365 [Candidatus Asgardarchaeum californiense]